MIGWGAFLLLYRGVEGFSAQTDGKNFPAIGIEEESSVAHESGVASVAFSPDGKYIASGGHDWALRLWESNTGELVKEVFFRHTEHTLDPEQFLYMDVMSVAFSPDGRYLAAGLRDRTVRVFNLATGVLLRVLSGQEKEGAIRGLDFSPNGLFIASAGAGGTVRFWETETGRSIRTIDTQSKEHREPRPIAYSPSGKHLLANWKNVASLWEVASGKQIRIFNTHSFVTSAAFSPDGKTIIAGGETIQLFDTQTGKEIRKFSVNSKFESVRSIAFSPDGRYVASGGYSSPPQLWNVETGKKIRSFEGQDGTVNGVAFSPDGRYIISGSYDGTLWLWDVETGKQVRAFKDTDPAEPERP